MGFWMCHLSPGSESRAALPPSWQPGKTGPRVHGARGSCGFLRQGTGVGNRWAGSIPAIRASAEQAQIFLPSRGPGAVRPLTGREARKEEREG